MNQPARLATHESADLACICYHSPDGVLKPLLEGLWTIHTASPLHVLIKATPKYQYPACLPAARR
jgi:hypothetical protein